MLFLEYLLTNPTTANDKLKMYYLVVNLWMVLPILYFKFVVKI